MTRDSVAAESGIHPTRPLPACGLRTPNQPGRIEATSSTVGEPYAVRRPTRAIAWPPGAVRITVVALTAATTAPCPGGCAVVGRRAAGVAGCVRPAAVPAARIASGPEAAFPAVMFRPISTGTSGSTTARTMSGTRATRGSDMTANVSVHPRPAPTSAGPPRRHVPGVRV